MSAPEKEPQPLPNVPLIHRPGSTVASASIDRPPLQERKRLMVVDDEPAVLRLVTRILANDNYELASADSGEAAVRLMDQPDFAGVDLLVTDLMMPGINGRELAAVVRQRNAAVRVLYVTGFADTLFKGVNELGPGESFIEKPFGAEGLLEATRLLMFGYIGPGTVPADKRDDGDEQWSDGRLRTKVIRLLRRMRMA